METKTAKQNKNNNSSNIEDLLFELTLTKEERIKHQAKIRAVNFRKNNRDKKLFNVYLDLETKDLILTNKPEDKTIKDFIKECILKALKIEP